MNNINNYESNIPINKIKGIISLYNLIFDDGNMGIYHSYIVKYYLYLSRLQYEKGYEKDTFISLNKALNYAIK